MPRGRAAGQLLPGLRCAACRFLPLFLVKAFLKGFSDRASFPGRGQLGRRFPGLALRCGRGAGRSRQWPGAVPVLGGVFAPGCRWLEAPGSPQRPPLAWWGQEQRSAAGWLIASGGEGPTWPAGVWGGNGPR